MKIFGDKSMLQITVDRLAKIKKINEIFIITRNDLYKPIVKNIKGINEKKYRTISDQVIDNLPEIADWYEDNFLKEQNF